MSKRDLEQLQALIEVIVRGQIAYSSAAVACELPANREVFVRMANARTRVIATLTASINRRASAGRHAFGSVLCKLYPDMAAGLDERFDAEWLAASQFEESATRKAMCTAITAIESSELKSLLRDVYPEVNCPLERLPIAS